MSIDKAAAAKIVSVPHGEPVKTLDETPARDLEVLSLALEPDDQGGDPYNHTGQFYVDALRRRKRSEG